MYIYDYVVKFRYNVFVQIMIVAYEAIMSEYFNFVKENYKFYWLNTQ